jgi:predicted ferric reductase
VIETLVANVKARAVRTAQSAACAAVVAIAGLVALMFFLAALFVWVEARFGTLEACLMFGGGFAVVAVLAMIALVVLRRHRPPPLNVAAAMPWNDPTMVMGLQAVKSLGGRRAGAIGLVGAFVVGLILSRTIGTKK